MIETSPRLAKAAKANTPSHTPPKPPPGEIGPDLRNLLLQGERKRALDRPKPPRFEPLIHEGKYKLNEFMKHYIQTELTFDVQNAGMVDGTNPMVIELQGYLNQMKDPNAPDMRLIVLKNGKDPTAYVYPDGTIVTNQALINRMGNKEEVVAILAHEQTHFESNHYQKKIEAGGYSLVTLKDERDTTGLKRLFEYQADLTPLSKLSSIGMDSMAMESALGKLRPKKNKDMMYDSVFDDNVHGTTLDRRENIFEVHGFIDFPTSGNGDHSGEAIPREWKREVDRTMIDKLTRSVVSHKYRKLLAEAPPEVLAEHTRQLMDIEVPEMGKGKESSHLIDTHRDLAKLAEIAHLVDSRLREAGLEGEQARYARLLCLTEGMGIDFAHWQTLAQLSLLRRFPRTAILTHSFDISTEEMNPEAITKILTLHKESTQPGGFYESVGVPMLVDANPVYLFDAEHPKYGFVFGGALRDAVVVPDDKAHGKQKTPTELALLFKAQADAVEKMYGFDMAQNWYGSHIQALVARMVEDHGFFTHAFPTEITKKVGLLNRTNQESLLEVGKFLATLSDAEQYGQYAFKPNRAFINQLIRGAYREHSYWPAPQSAQDMELATTLLSSTAFPVNPDLKNDLYAVINQSQGEKSTLVSLLHESPDDFFEQLARFRRQAFFFDREQAKRVVNFVIQEGASYEKPIQILPTTIAAMEKAGIAQEEIPAETKKRYQQLLFTLDVITVLTAERAMNQADRIAFIGDCIDKDFLKSLPTVLLDDFTRRLLYGKVPLQYERYGTENVSPIEAAHQLLGATPSSLQDIDKALIQHFPLLQQLGESILPAPDAPFEDIIKRTEYYHSFFRYKNESVPYFGHSESSARLLSPFHTQLVTAIEQQFANESSFTEQAQAFSAIREYLPATRELNDVLETLAIRLIDKGTLTEGLQFLEDEAKKGKGSLQLIDHFIEHKVFTYPDYQQCKQRIFEVIQTLTSSADNNLGAYTKVDGMIEHESPFVKTPELLEAMLTSGTNDNLLRQQLVRWYYKYAIHPTMERTPTFNTTRQELEQQAEALRGYKVVIENGQPKVVGTAPHAFRSFNDIITGLESTTQLQRMGILRKLLLSHGGILTNQKYHEEAARLFGKRLKPGDALSSLLEKIVFSALREGDPVRTFTPIASALEPMILQKPSQPGSNDNAIEAIREQERYYSYPGKQELLGAMDKILSMQSNQERIAALANQREEIRSLNDGFTHLQDTLTKQFGMKIESSLFIANGEISPVDVILEMGKALGPMGKRFLQVAGQYFNLTEEQREKFSEVYDAMPGQSKFTLFAMLERRAKTDEATRVMLDDPNFRVVKRIGGGSVNTIFLIERTNRQDPTKIQLGVLRARNPNAEKLVKEMAKQAKIILEGLKKIDSTNRRQYALAEQLLGTIENWVISDIHDKQFLRLDPLFRQASNGTHNGVTIVVPRIGNPSDSSLGEPYDDELKYEDLVVGVTENKLTTSFKSQDTQAQETTRRAVEASIWLLAQQLVKPAFSEQGEHRYIIRGDFHAGNEMVATLILQEQALADLADGAGEGKREVYGELHADSDLTQESAIKVYPIDRGFYQELSEADAHFVRDVLMTDNPKEKLTLMATYCLKQPENAHKRYSPQQLVTEVGIGLFLEQARINEKEADNPFAQLNNVMRAFHKRGVKIPLKIIKIFINLEAAKRMQEQVGLSTSVTDFIKEAASSI